MADTSAELVEILADEGVTHLFINPGSDTAPLQEALAGARAAGTPHPESVLCMHEHVALTAAIGHHHLSGRQQAVLVHVDAGTLNVGGALHQAQRNATPVVIMAGRTPYSNDPDVPGHRDGAWMWPQEQLDQAGAMRNYCKWAMEAPRGREAGRILRRAFQVSGSTPAGPCYVMLSREALMEQAGTATLPLARPHPPAPDPRGLASLARMLGDAERPVIVTGRVGRNPDSVAVLVRISEMLGAPVLDERDRQNFPRNHRLYAGPDGRELLKTADAVLIVDSQVPWVPALAAPPKSAQIGLIDVDPVKATMPLWDYPVTVSLIADSALALPLLEVELQALAPKGRSDRWRRRGEEVAAKVAEIHASWKKVAQGGGHPARAAEAYLAALNVALPEDAVVLEEAVTNRAGCIRQIDRRPGHYFQSGAPSLGWAIGAGLGAKLARPDLPIVAVCGDGSFNFGVPTAALWSAHKAKAPFVTVILNNRAYNASKEPVVELYPDGAALRHNDFYESRLGPSLDYVGLARACGGQGEVVNKPSEMAPALERALAWAASGQCAVLDVVLPEL
jgi:acetolactate synthase I/II/III large subunit